TRPMCIHASDKALPILAARRSQPRLAAAAAKAFTPDLTRAGHRGCSTDAYPGSRLSGRPLGWTGRTAPPLRGSSRPLSWEASASAHRPAPAPPRYRGRLHHLPGAPRSISGHRGAGFVTVAAVGRSWPRSVAPLVV